MLFKNEKKNQTKMPIHIVYQTENERIKFLNDMLLTNRNKTTDLKEKKNKKKLRLQAAFSIFCTSFNEQVN